MYNKISRKLKKCTRILAALVFLFAFFLSNPKAYADDLSESIKVSQKISINSPYAKPQDSFTYILESVSKDAPLPEEASGSYKFSLRGDETKDLSITFTKAGEYTYKLYQEKSDIKNVTQDKEVYTIIIRIGEVDGKLVKEVLVINNSSGKKVENIEFHNIYKIEENGVAPIVDVAGSACGGNVFCFVERLDHLRVRRRYVDLQQVAGHNHQVALLGSCL